jgi:hypothetical protein
VFQGMPILSLSAESLVRRTELVNATEVSALNYLPPAPCPPKQCPSAPPGVPPSW